MKLKTIKMNKPINCTIPPTWYYHEIHSCLLNNTLLFVWWSSKKREDQQKQKKRRYKTTKKNIYNKDIIILFNQRGRVLAVPSCCIMVVILCKWKWVGNQEGAKNDWMKIEVTNLKFKAYIMFRVPHIQLQVVRCIGWVLELRLFSHVYIWI